MCVCIQATIVCIHASCVKMCKGMCVCLCVHVSVSKCVCVRCVCENVHDRLCTNYDSILCVAARNTRPPILSVLVYETCNWQSLELSYKHARALPHVSRSVRPIQVVVI